VITGLNDAKDTNLIGTRAWISQLRWLGAGHLAVRDQPKILDQVRAFMARSSG
jgi:hypothetical protein